MNDAVPGTVRVARPKVKSLLAQFRAEPTGEAGDLLEALLLSHLVREETKAEEADLEKLHQERRKSERLRHDVEELAVQVLNLEERKGKLVAEVEQAQFERRQMRECLEVVQEAAAQGRPFDEAAVFRRISAALGISGDMQNRIEPGYPGEKE